MDMTPEQKKVYKTLPPEARRDFREAVELDDLTTIARYMQPLGDEKRGRGRPDLDLTSSKEILRCKQGKQLRAVKSINGFNKEIVGDGAGLPDDINNFRDLYQLTIDDVKSRFFIDNEYVINKHPYVWYNRLLMALKKELPRVTIDQPQRVAVAWDAFKGLMYDIGLFPTYEAFQNLTGIYKEQVSKQLSPDWVQLSQKMFADCKASMLDQVNINPATQINKIFILKSVYGYTEAGPAAGPIEAKKVRNIDDMPLFSLEDKQDNT